MATRKRAAGARKKRRVLPVDRLRKICLALPEAEERETWEIPTFRVRGKIFTMYVEDEDDRPGLWCKAPPGSQAILVGADGERFFVPPYVGHKGWVGMRLDRRANWREVALLVERSWRMTAPKLLARRLAIRPLSRDRRTSEPRRSGAAGRQPFRCG